MSAEIYRRKCKRKLLYISRKIEDGHISDDEEEGSGTSKSRKLNFQQLREKKVGNSMKQISSSLKTVKPWLHPFRNEPSHSEEFGSGEIFNTSLPSCHKNSHNTSWISHIFKSDEDEEDLISIDCISSDHSEAHSKVEEKNGEIKLLDTIDSISVDSKISKSSIAEDNTINENIDLVASDISKSEALEAEEEALIESRESNDEHHITYPDSLSQQSHFIQTLDSVKEHTDKMHRFKGNLTFEAGPSSLCENPNSTSSVDISHNSSPNKTTTTGLKVEQWLNTLQWHSKIPENVQGSECSTEDKIVLSISPPLSPNEGSTPKIKVAEWLKSIHCQLKTPKNNNQKDCYQQLESSKKKKYISGGLAEYALRLDAREKSLKNIWLHQRSHSSVGQDKSSILIMKIIHSFSEGGLVIARCKEFNALDFTNVTKQSPVSDSSIFTSKHLNQIYASRLFNDTVQNRDNLIKNDRLCENKESKVDFPGESCQNIDSFSKDEYKVLISMDDYSKLKLSAGSLIKIHPPWQKLNLSSTSEPVILCTYFIEVLNINIPDKNLMNNDELSQKEVALYKWNCLCRIDPSIQPTLCSATDVETQHTCLEKEICHAITHESSGKIMSPGASNTLKQLILAPVDSPSCIASHSDNPKGLILFSYELLTGSVTSNESVAICGIVQRVWRFSSSRMERGIYDSSNCSTVSNTRWCILLQDAEGAFCELYLSNISSSSSNNIASLNEITYNGEGNAFWFSNIRVTHRRTSARHPALFSVLKEICRQQNKSTWNTQVEPLLHPFCYVLIANQWESKVPTTLKDSLPPYCPPYLQCLKDILLNPSKDCRFSFAAKVVWNRRNILYITDPSLNKRAQEETDVSSIESYMKLHLYFESIKSSALDTNPEGAVIIVTECKFHEDVLAMDKYSSLTVVTPFKLSHHHNYSHLISKTTTDALAKLQLYCCLMKKLNATTCKIGDLVEVEGQITGVDEDTALSWLECEHCHGQDLIQGSGGEIQCEICKEKVSDPIIKINLEVFLEIPEHCRIKLLEATAVKLLPKLMSSSLQPLYALSDILNKKLGPIICSVEDLQYNQAKKPTHVFLNQVT